MYPNTTTDRRMPEVLELPYIPVAREGGLLPIEFLGSPVAVNFPVWPAAETGYTYQLVFDGQRIAPEKQILPTDKPGDVLEVHIPVSYLTEGTHAVSYRVYSMDADSEVLSGTTPIQVDRTAPGAPDLGPIIFPELVQDGLTSDELESLNNVLVGRIASYSGMAMGDVVRSYWGKLEGPMVSVDANDMGLDRVMVSFPRALMEQVGDVEEQVHYTVTDLAGNVSMKSEAVKIRLQLSVVTPLPTPSIKEAQGDTLDPENTPDGATVVIAKTANFRAGDFVQIHWNGPKGSDEKERFITEAQTGKQLSVTFARSLISANVGQRVNVSYRVTRASGVVQQSDPFSVRVMSAWLELTAPTMDTVDMNGIVRPSRIPESGATARVHYSGMLPGDQVKVIWSGASRYETAVQLVTGTAELVFNVPKALIMASIGQSASLSYNVTRTGAAKDSEVLALSVQAGLELDTSPVTLNGKVYLLPGYPDLLPAFPANTTVQRNATGGQAPYTYRSSNPTVAQVNAQGLTSVRGKGTANISVTDATGQTLSYSVSVTGVIHCLGVGSGKYVNIKAAADREGARLPSLQELKEIFNTYGNRWPMGNSNYWSSTLRYKWTPFGATYWIKNLVTGFEIDAYAYSNILGVAVR